MSQTVDHTLVDDSPSLILDDNFLPLDDEVSLDHEASVEDETSSDETSSDETSSDETSSDETSVDDEASLEEESTPPSPSPPSSRNPQPTRLTKFKRGTYASETGPFPNDTNWSKLTVKLLKANCEIRGLPKSGVKAVLIGRLTDYVQREERPEWMKEEDGEKLYVLEILTSTLEPARRYEFLDEKNKTHKVEIGAKISCSCDDSQNSSPLCQHTTYTLKQVLKVPVHLLYRFTLDKSELEQIFRNAPVVARPLDQMQGTEEIDPNLKAEDCTCPVCFKNCGHQGPAVRCTLCQHFVHRDCFNKQTAHIYKYFPSSAFKCPVCKGKWTVPGVWGEAALTEKKPAQEPGKRKRAASAVTPKTSANRRAKTSHPQSKQRGRKLFRA